MKKRSDHLKKMLSTLLTFMLLFSLIPTTLIAQAAGEALSGVKTEFLFTRNGYADNTAADLRDSSYATIPEGSLRPWTYVSDTITGPAGTAPSNIALLTNYLQACVAAAGERIVLKVNIATAGRYKPILKYYSYGVGGIVDVYLIPNSEDAAANTANYMTSENKLGTLDTYNGGKAAYVEGSLTNNDAVVSTPGDYLLVFSSVGKNASSSGYNMIIQKFILDGRVLLDSAQITLDKSEITQRQTAAATVSGLMNDGTVASGYTVTYASSNTAVATVNASTGVITGVAAGSANITATLTKDGVTKTATASITVNTAALSGGNIIYKFWQNAYSDVTVPDGRTYTTFVGDRPWAYVSDTFTGGATPVSLLAYYLQLAGNQNARVVFEIKVPKAGRYRAKLGYYRYNYGGIADIYLVPKSEDAVANPQNYMTSQYLLDSVDTYYNGSAVAFSEDINDVVFDTADNYLLIFCGAAKNASSGGYNLLINNLSLEGRTLTSAQININKNNIEIGDIVSATATGLYEDSAVISDAAVEYSSSNPAVATVDSVTGSITALSAGTTDISATVQKYGVTLNASKTITVKAATTFSAAVQTYDFKKAAACVLDTTYSNTLNTWQYAGSTSGWTPNSTKSTLQASYAQIYFGKGAIGKWVALEVDIPTAGRYHSSLTYLKAYYGCTSDVYLIPSTGAGVNTDVEAGLTGDGYLGQFSGSGTGSATKTLSDFTVPIGGKYYLVFKLINKGTVDDCCLYINYFTLNGVVLGSTDLSLNNTEIDFGGSATASASSLMNDNSAAAGTTYAFASSNSNIATIDPSTGAITGVSAGRVRISVTATLNGVTVTNNKIVTVGHTSAAAQGALRISVSNSTGSSLNDVAVSGDASTPSFTLNEQGNFNTGTTFIVTAPAVAGKTFLYWKNATSKRVVTTSQTCTFKIGSNTYLTAVYKETGSGVMVEFVDKNGKVLNSTFLNETTTSVNAPTPYSIGYDFQSWKAGALNIAGGSEVTSALISAADTRFIAQYIKSTAQYSVTVTGSTADGTTTHNYEDLISLTASAPAGKEFAYWTRNGQIISYSPSYSFYVWDNATVAAVYVTTGEALPPIPQVMMDTEKTAAGRVIFSAERTVPDGYELVESGILITSDSASATNTAFNLQTAGVIKAITQSTQKNGQFTVRRDNITGTWYARAYLLYKDTATSQFKTVYSNIVYGTAQ